MALCAGTARARLSSTPLAAPMSFTSGLRGFSACRGDAVVRGIVSEIEDLIQQLRAQRTMAILLVEQFLDFAMSVSDYCYVMEKGSIVAEGAAGELQQDAIREYLAL